MVVLQTDVILLKVFAKNGDSKSWNFSEQKKNTETLSMKEKLMLQKTGCQFVTQNFKQLADHARLKIQIRLEFEMIQYFVISGFQCDFNYFNIDGGTCLQGASDLFIHCKLENRENLNIYDWEPEKPEPKQRWCGWVL